ncbi:hypothetical protein [Planctomicrobium sp. SH527]|uniref:hypothetical protein n=1 Tax=Planctomicrobium sp. SH527 TaxID=3448123 RepID=UPI003F5AFA55
MPPEGRLPQLLQEQLQRVRNRVLGVSVADGLGLTLFVASLLTGCGLLIDFFFELPVPVRVAMLFVVPIVVLLLVVWKIVLPFLKQYRKTELAAVVEIAHPELRERLLSTVELVAAPIDERDRGSAFMQQMLLQQTIDFAAKTDFSDVIPTQRAVRRCWIGAVTFLVLLVPFVFATNAYATLLTRFLNPWGNYERLQNLILEVDEPHRTVGRGDDISIVARPSWRFHERELPLSIQLDWIEHGKVTQSRVMDWSDEKKGYVAQLPSVVAGFEFQLSADHSRSRLYRIDVVDRPDVKNFVVDVVPPGYTGNPAEHHDPLLGEILTIEQSVLEMQLTFDKSINSAEILWLDGSGATGGEAVRIDESVQGLPVRHRTELTLNPDGLGATCKLTAALSGPSGRFAVRLRDQYDLNAREETIRRLTIQPDAPPTIRFTDREQNPEARTYDLLRFPVEATDEYGLTAMELHYEWTRNSIKESQVIAIPADELKPLATQYQFVVDLSKHALPAGTQVTVRARALDNRPVPGPNETWSETRQLQIKVDAKSQGDQTLEDLQNRTNQALNQLTANIEKQRQAARKLQNQAQQEKANEQEANSSAEAENLAEELRSLNEQLQKLAAVMEQQPVFEHLAQKAQEISEQSLAQAADKAEKAQKAASAGEKQQQFSEAANALQKAGKDLDTLQNDFEELSQLQRDLLELNRIADQTEKLAGDVDGLAVRQTLNQTSALARQQWQQDHHQMIARHRQIEDDLDVLLEKHPDLMDKAREVLHHRLSALADQSELLARQQTTMASATRNEATRKRKEAEEKSKSDSESAEKSDPQAPAPMAEKASGNAAQPAPATSPAEDANSAKDAAETKAPPSIQALGDQKELMQRGRRLTSSVRQLGLKDPALHKGLTDFPDSAKQTTESLHQLNFNKAAETANRAAENAQKLADALRNQTERRIPERLMQQADEAAEAQRELADRMKTLAESPTGKSEFRQELQMAYEAETEALSKELEQRAQNLNLERIHRPEQSKLSAQAGEQAGKAAEALKQSVAQSESANLDDAAKSIDQSAEPLRQAGQLARQASSGANPKRPPATNIPGEVGVQVAESSQQLNDAGELLSQLKELSLQMPGTDESNQNPEIRSMPSKEGKGDRDQSDGQDQQPGKPGQGDQKSESQEQQNGQGKNSASGKGQESMAAQSQSQAEGQSSSGQQQGSEKSRGEATSTTLREAAQGLRRAAHQMGISANQSKGEQQEPQQNGKESQQSTSNDASSSAFNGQAHLQMLEKSVGNATGRNWGKLPGKLQTEMIESSLRPRDPTYRGLIRRYFEDISKTRAPELETEKGSK